MAAALALEKAGLNAICVGPGPELAQADHRTTALLHGSVTFLNKRLGIWDELKPHAAPISKLSLIDRTGRLFRAPDAMFSATEIGAESFGFNIPNSILTQTFRERLGDKFLASEGVTVLQADGDVMRLTLNGGETLNARLVVGADGRNSMCRESQSIPVKRWAYEQTAVVCNLRHTRPHHGACTEFHHKSGPLTIVPLPGDASSLVWVMTPDRAAELTAKDDSEFLAVLSAELSGLLGDLVSAGPRGAFPLSSLIAQKLTGERLALAGEAAHVMPPIGAQGLNLGFRDVADLAECVAGAADPGAPEILADYARRRARDVWTRTLAADLLNRTLISNLPLFQLARGIGLTALSANGPLRRAAMKQGMSAMLSP
jgi:2-octaprenyl-6-methoxyphenol hydroxylase